MNFKRLITLSILFIFLAISSAVFLFTALSWEETSPERKSAPKNEPKTYSGLGSANPEATIKLKSNGNEIKIHDFNYTADPDSFGLGKPDSAVDHCSGVNCLYATYFLDDGRQLELRYLFEVPQDVRVTSPQSSYMNWELAETYTKDQLSLAFLQNNAVADITPAQLLAKFKTPDTKFKKDNRDYIFYDFDNGSRLAFTFSDGKLTSEVLEAPDGGVVWLSPVSEFGSFIKTFPGQYELTTPRDERGYTTYLGKLELTERKYTYTASANTGGGDNCFFNKTATGTVSIGFRDGFNQESIINDMQNNAVVADINFRSTKGEIAKAEIEVKIIEDQINIKLKDSPTCEIQPKTWR